jgi:hypothetical protein
MCSCTLGKRVLVCCLYAGEGGLTERLAAAYCVHHAVGDES